MSCSKQARNSVSDFVEFLSAYDPEVTTTNLFLSKLELYKDIVIPAQHKTHVRGLVKVLFMHTDPVQSDRFGKVTGAWLLRNNGTSGLARLILEILATSQKDYQEANCLGCKVICYVKSNTRMQQVDEDDQADQFDEVPSFTNFRSSGSSLELRRVTPDHSRDSNVISRRNLQHMLSAFHGNLMENMQEMVDSAVSKVVGKVDTAFKDAEEIRAKNHDVVLTSFMETNKLVTEGRDRTKELSEVLAADAKARAEERAQEAEARKARAEERAQEAEARRAERIEEAKARAETADSLSSLRKSNTTLQESLSVLLSVVANQQAGTAGGAANGRSAVGSKRKAAPADYEEEAEARKGN
jgi:hypothetical protein